MNQPQRSLTITRDTFSFAVGVSLFGVNNMVDPIYKVWFPQAFVEEEDESLIRAVEEIEEEERVLDDD